MAYQCKLCSAEFQTVASYVTHTQIHANLPRARFPCCVDRCTRSFMSYAAIRQHILRYHSFYPPSQQNRLCHVNVSATCPVESCIFQADDCRCFLSHLKTHFGHNINIDCPFGDCSQSFTIKSSFSSHISRKHPNWSAATFKPTITGANHISIDNTVHPGNNDQSLVVVDAFEENSMEVAEVVDGSTFIDANAFLKNVALFYLKLQSKYLLPAATIDDIVYQVVGIHNLNREYLVGELISHLGVEFSKEQITGIVDSVQSSDLLKQFHGSNGPLRSNYSRQEYFKNNFSYVAPRSIRLGVGLNNKVRFCHYIPVRETLVTLFSDQSVLDQFHNPVKSEDGVYCDYTDGAVFKQNSLVVNNNKVINIILYQDAFEVVNPLGSSRIKHKVLGVYFMLGNLHTHNRSKIVNTQLVLLCKEKDLTYFGQKQVFSELITDLKVLETTGILINGDSIPVVVHVIAGDNLGSHTIGGFVENFNGTYFCRYCEITKEQFTESPFSSIPSSLLRSPNTYCAALEQLENGQLHVKGVKADSVFNELKYFHVCNPGLPPCIAHDLFEGIVNYDLALFIKYFVKKKWFTYAELNRIIDQFKYKGSDAKTKPCSVKEKKLGGTACQNWCILRLLPILLYAHIADPEDEVWKLTMQLQELVELVVAPKISMDQVAYLQLLIQEYLWSRKRHFPDTPLRPKHHFVAHYPQLILQFGPLIRVWTLRFESKHQFFKRCIRYSQNFINITKTLSEKHQLLQAYNHSNELFSTHIEVKESLKLSLCLDTYCTTIKSAIGACENHENSFDWQVTVKAVVKSTQYEKEDIVILDESNDDGVPVLASIILILVNGNTDEVHFLLRKMETHSVAVGRIIEITKYSPDIILCLSHSSLLDYHPLQTYRRRGKDLVTLRHMIVHSKPY